METIEIICRKRQLRQLTTAVKSVIRWNTGYIINFSFDEEWGDAKTLRIVNDKGEIIDDILFMGNTVELPKIYDTKHIGIGVYEGDLKSTTELILSCKKSILDYDGGTIEPPTEDVYNKIIEALNSKANAIHSHTEYAEKNVIESMGNQIDEMESVVDKTVESFETVANMAEEAFQTAKGFEKDITDVNTAIGNKAEKDHEHDGYAKDSDMPTKVSQLENDKGYLTEHQDISGLASKATTLSGYGIIDAYTKGEIDLKIGDIDLALDNIISIQNQHIGGDGV